MTNEGLIAIAAAIAVCAGMFTGIGEGLTASKAVDKIRLMMIVGCGITETVAIYGLLVSFILLFIF